MDRYEKKVADPYEKTVNSYEKMIHDVMMMYMLVDLNTYDLCVVVVVGCVGRLVVSLRPTIEIGPSIDALQVIDQRSKSRNEEKKEKENEHEEGDEVEKKEKHKKDGKDDEDE